MGTDSAPPIGKLSPCGCAAIFAPVAMGCLAQVFEQENSLDKLERLLYNGAGFYDYRSFIHHNINP